jgi:Protein of unknown function (DUF1800)
LRCLADGEETRRTGRFHFVRRWHDTYLKRILGREFPLNCTPMQDGEEVLDMLARHPGSAAFVSAKIARRLLADDPDPAFVQRLAVVFLTKAHAPDQIARVVRALVLSPDFDTPPTCPRRRTAILLPRRGSNAGSSDLPCRPATPRAGSGAGCSTPHLPVRSPRLRSGRCARPACLGRMPGRWPGLANEVLEEGADLAVVTDRRAVLAELLSGHMRLADPQAVFPGSQPQTLGLWE